MKYLKLAVILLSAWLIVYVALVSVSLHAAAPDTSTVAVDLMQRNLLPQMLQPSHYTYTDGGKSLRIDGATLDRYAAAQRAMPLAQRLAQAVGLDEGHPGAGLLYDWCIRVLPWLSLLLALWLLNVAAGIKRLADTLSGSK